jgi:hypothetical protein
MKYSTVTSAGRISRFSSKSEARNEMLKYTGAGHITLHVDGVATAIKHGNKNKIVAIK